MIDFEDFMIVCIVIIYCLLFIKVWSLFVCCFSERIFGGRFSALDPLKKMVHFSKYISQYPGTRYQVDGTTLFKFEADDSGD